MNRIRSPEANFPEERRGVTIDHLDEQLVSSLATLLFQGQFEKLVENSIGSILCLSDEDTTVVCFAEARSANTLSARGRQVLDEMDAKVERR